MELGAPVFWLAVLQIIAIDIVLGGDNALVIGMASRRLSARQRNRAIVWGVFGAIALRVLLILFALKLLQIAYLKFAGGVLLLWIGVRLLKPQDDVDYSLDASTHLMGAIKTIVLADAVMSLDNVIAIAAAAKGSLIPVVFALFVSVPLVVWGSKLVLALMDRFPILIVAGAALLGWIAGDMMVHDVAMSDWVGANAAWLKYGAPPIGAMAVALVGRIFIARAAAAAARANLTAADQKSR